MSLSLQLIWLHRHAGAADQRRSAGVADQRWGTGVTERWSRPAAVTPLWLSQRCHHVTSLHYPKGQLQT